METPAEEKEFNSEEIQWIKMEGSWSALPATQTISEILRSLHTSEGLNSWIKQCRLDTNLISDGFHTFGELYEHRIELFIALCRVYDYTFTYHHDIENLPWRSLCHSDGSAWDGWFIMGLGRSPGEQKTYHLPMSKWEETAFCETLERAPEYDGHTPQDVLERLKKTVI